MKLQIQRKQDSLETMGRVSIIRKRELNWDTIQLRISIGAVAAIVPFKYNG